MGFAFSSGAPILCDNRGSGRLITSFGVGAVGGIVIGTSGAKFGH